MVLRSSLQPLGIISAIAVYGLISAADLRHVMTNLGEKLTYEEVDEILTVLGLRDDQEIPIDQIIDLFTVE